MLKLYDKGVYLLNGTEIVEEKEAVAAKTGKDVTPQEAAKNTMAYNILAAHNTSGNMERLQIKFDNRSLYCSYPASGSDSGADRQVSVSSPLIQDNCFRQ